MTDDVHFFLSASSAFRWRYCSGSASLAPLFPEPDTDDARAGTASHWYGSELLLGRTPGDTAPNGVMIDDDMRAGAMMWVEDVQNLIKKYEGRSTATLQVEVKGQATDIHPEHCGGTPDSVLILHGVKRIIIGDYKYGHGEVDPFENEQCLIYANQIADQIGLDGSDDQQWTVEFRIIQPRCYTADGPVRSWASNLAALRGHFNKLRDAAEAALSPNTQVTSGPWCKHCPARGPCKANRQATMSALDIASAAAIEPLTPDSVSFELGLLERASELINSRKVAMEMQAEQFIKRGKSVPGYGMTVTKTHLKWKSEHDAATIRALGEAYGIRLDKEEFITPTQAIGKGIDETVINAYAHRPAGAMKLAKDSTSRIIRILQNNPTQ